MTKSQAVSWQRVIVVLALVLGLLLMLSVFSGSVKLFSVPTNGMAPTIRSGDRVVATRIFSPGKSVTKGDVVIFDARRAHPTLRSKFVQRVVATGGDRVEVIGERLHVNGQPLPEREGLFSTPSKAGDPRFPALAYPYLIPPGKIFTLGDNYANSLDSRYFGAFPVEAVTHSADRVIFPLARAGKID